MVLLAMSTLACDRSEDEAYRMLEEFDAKMAPLDSPVYEKWDLLFELWEDGEYETAVQFARAIEEMEKEAQYMTFYGPPLVELLCQAVYDSDYENMARLITDGADVNGRLGDGDTPLLAACAEADVRAAKMLIEAGADPNDKKYLTPWPIHAAATSGNVELVTLLIESRADPNQPDIDECFPLHDACRTAHGEVVDVLLAAGAQPNMNDELDLPPLWHAIQAGSLDCVHVLLEYGASTHSRHRLGYFIADIMPSIPAKPFDAESIMESVQYAFDVSERSLRWTGMMNAIQLAEFMISEPRARRVVYWNTQLNGEMSSGVYDDGIDRTPIRGGQYDEVFQLLREHSR